MVSVIRICAVVIAVCGGATANVVAQGSARPARPVLIDPANGVSLFEAIRQGLEREPMLQAVRAEIDIARGDRVQSGLRPRPTISAERQDQIDGMDAITRIDVMWPLDLFRRSARLATADRSVDVSVGAADERRRTTALAIADAYGQLLGVVGELEVVDAFVASLEQTMALIDARVTAGAAPALERFVAEVELLRSRADRVAREADLERARVALLRQLGLPPTNAARLAAPLDDVVTMLTARTRDRLPSVPTVDNRPDVRLAEAIARLAEARVVTAHREGRLDLALTGGYMRSRTGFPFQAFDADSHLAPIENSMQSVAVGAAITVPFFNRNQGSVASALAARTRSEHEARAVRLSAEADVAAALASDARSREALAVFATGLRDRARSNVDVVRETYTLGAATLSDVLQEQRRHLEVELAYLRALGAAYSASTALLGALGELP